MKNLSTLLLLLCIANLLNITAVKAQNSMTGDGFGGRLWYQPTNYAVGSYSAYTVCGSNNQLYGWGSNQFGQLGTGDTLGTTSPVAVFGMTDVVRYTTGYVSCAIKSDSSAWAWGNPIYYFPFVTIGSGMGLSPSPIMPAGVKFTDAGQDIASFVKYDGTVWSIGDNSYGAFGDGTTTTVGAIPIATQMTGINNAVRVAVFGGPFQNSNSDGIIVLLSDGTLRQTGGHGMIQPYDSTLTFLTSSVPGLSGEFIVDVKANSYAVYVLNSIGEVYAWGDGHNGELGLGGFITQTYIATKLAFPQGAGSIVALSTQDDGNTALALDEYGNVYGWGINFFGELGLADPLYASPTLIATGVKDILCGETFSYIIKTDGTLWATGKTNWYNNVGGSIWMDLPNIQRNSFTQIHPQLAPMNLCAVKVFGTIPVKLISFELQRNLNSIGIYWNTTNELNLHHFEVEFSFDQRNWSILTTHLPKNGINNYYQANDI